MSDQTEPAREHWIAYTTPDERHATYVRTDEPTDTTAYVPVYDEPAEIAAAALAANTAVRQDKAPSPPKVARPTGGLRTFVGVIMSLAGVTLVGAFAIVCWKFLLMLWWLF